MSQTLPRPIRVAELPFRFLVITSELLLAAIVGLGLLAIGADGTAWILGGIISGAIVLLVSRNYFHLDIAPNPKARKIGQLLVGLVVGFSVQHSGLLALSTQIPLFILLTLGLLLSGIVVAWIYTKLEKTDALTAVLATTPGNIGVMASVAADYGRNPALVSLVQLMRFTAITSAIPLMTSVEHSTNIGATLTKLMPNVGVVDGLYWAWLGLMLLAAGASVQVGAKLRLPVPGLLCPLVVGTSFNTLFNLLPGFASVDFVPPTGLNVLGQILLGVTIGEYWAINPKLERGTIVRATVPAALTLLAGLLMAGIAMLITPWSWLTCLLVTAPGGSPEMIWIALALDQNVEIVTAGHLVRLIAINVLLPVIITLAKALHQPTTHIQSTPNLQLEPKS